MPEVVDAVMALYESLMHAYDHDGNTNEERDAFIDTLAEYTHTVALAATHAFAELVGVDPDRVSMLNLTERQYHQLEASGMLDIYITGKDTTDD